MNHLEENSVVKQMTIRSNDKELEKRLEQLARKEGISINKAVLKLLRRGVGMNEKTDQENRIGSALDSFIGTWTDEEADELLKAVEDLEKIDRKFWQ